MDKVSIVVPIYNREKFLDKCINSLINQTYNNIEILLIDDGSKDNSFFVCKKYASIDNRIVLIKKENGGVQSARNKGIESASGKYLTFVDADDYVSKNFISNFITKYEEENSDVVLCGYKKVSFFENEYNIIDERNITTNLKIPNDDSERWALYFEKFACYCWSHCFKLDIIKKYNIKFDKDVIIFDDTAFSMDYMKHVKKISFTNSNDYYYIFEHTSHTVAKSLKKKRVCDIGSLRKAELILQKYHEIDNTKIKTSSILYYICCVSFLFYISVIYYDYRYDKSTKEKKFDYIYNKIKDSQIDKWSYDKEYLKSIFPSTKYIFLLMDIYNKRSKKFFYYIMKIYGLNIVHVSIRKIGNFTKRNHK
ncbi:MAG: glycosyltransferase [Eubacteriales bacterium]|nr:glycosyltransferase [Eubacteriales bacterium]